MSHQDIFYVETCRGCIENLANQEGHMGAGGCLDDKIWNNEFFHDDVSINSSEEELEKL